MVATDEFSNLYEILGLHEGASEKEVSRARAITVHPLGPLRARPPCGALHAA